VVAASDGEQVSQFADVLAAGVVVAVAAGELGDELRCGRPSP
jgi:hypothetical protein